MSAVPLSHFLILAAVLFGLGAIGVVLRRNALVLLMSVELMLNAGNLTFLAFARHHGGAEGQVIAFLVMALAAAEAAIGLAILLLVFRHRRSVMVDDLNELRG